MSLEDDETMQATLEMFSGMTNVGMIATRLVSRGAIRRDAFESVNRRLRSEEPDALALAASEFFLGYCNL